MKPEEKREALEIVMKVTRAARAGTRLELVAAFAEIEAGLRAQLEALPPPTKPASGADTQLQARAA